MDFANAAVQHLQLYLQESSAEGAPSFMQSSSPAHPSLWKQHEDHGKGLLSQCVLAEVVVGGVPGASTRLLIFSHCGNAK